MAGELEIVNMAILTIGELTIVNLGEDNKAANIADAFFQQSLESVLSEHNWTFARKRVVVSPDVTAPAFGYSARFALPADYNHIVLEETDTQEDFREEYGFIHSDSEELNLVYISNLVAADGGELPLMTPKFVDALVLFLAARMIYAMTSNEKMLATLEQLYERSLQKAKAADSIGIGLVEDPDLWDEDR